MVFTPCWRGEWCPRTQWLVCNNGKGAGWCAGTVRRAEHLCQLGRAVHLSAASQISNPAVVSTRQKAQHSDSKRRAEANLHPSPAAAGNVSAADKGKADVLRAFLTPVCVSHTGCARRSPPHGRWALPLAFRHEGAEIPAAAPFAFPLTALPVSPKGGAERPQERRAKRGRGLRGRRGGAGRRAGRRALPRPV